MSKSLRDILRDIPSLTGVPPTPFPTDPPPDPRDLLLSWLSDAINAHPPDPHTIHLSTVDEHDRPDSRPLIIKDVLPDGSIEIALSGSSPKSRQMSHNPNVALTWHCTPHCRTIRMRGVAELAPKEVCERDWKARSNGAKAVALAGKQSEPYEGDRGVLIKAKEEALASHTEDEEQENWQVWRVRPRVVEFWQGAKSRNHDRLRYTLQEGSGWKIETLWP